MVTNIADELSSKYDTLLIQTLDGKSYNIITNRPIYEDGKFDGYELFVGSYGEKTIFIKEVDETDYSFNFTEKVFNFPSKYNDAAVIDSIIRGEASNWLNERPYLAILSKGEIFFEHLLPIYCIPSESPEIDDVPFYLMLVEMKEMPIVPLDK